MLLRIQFFHKRDLADNVFPSDLCENIVEVVKQNRKKTNKMKKPIIADDLRNILLTLVQTHVLY